MFDTEEKYKYYFGVITLLRNQLGDAMNNEYNESTPMLLAFKTLNNLVAALMNDNYIYDGKGIVKNLKNESYE